MNTEVVKMGIGCNTRQSGNGLTFIFNDDYLITAKSAIGKIKSNNRLTLIKHCSTVIKLKKAFLNIQKGLLDQFSSKHCA